MKKYLIPLIILIALLAAACTRPAPANPTATPTQDQDVIKSVTELPYPAPVTLTPPPSETPFPTDPPAQATNTQELPTQPPTGGATATQAPAQPTTAASNTPGPTATPTLPPDNPFSSLGPASFQDPMTVPGSEKNWERDGVLPDNDLIKLAFNGTGQMEVTGRKLFFETWWFSWPYLDDFYITMDANSGECTGRDAYGLILRGPPRDTGDAWGYIVAFTCDGRYMVKRLDSFRPYSAVELIPWTSNPNIVTGRNQPNRIGVEADGSSLTIFANNYQIAELTDAKYSEGRYGVFIMAADTVNYKYLVDQITVWDYNE